MERAAYEKEYTITRIEYHDLKRIPNICCACPVIELYLVDEFKNVIYMFLTPKNFVKITKNYWWDGTGWGAHNFKRKLYGKKFSFKNGIE